MRTAKRLTNGLAVAVVAMVGLGAGKALAFGGISFHPIFGDDTSEISTYRVYTHAVDFGTGTPATVNGVVFQNGQPGFGPIAGTSATVGTGTSNIPTAHAGDDSAAPYLSAGGMRTLVRDMTYNAANAVLTLTGLTPGQPYRFRLYNRQWGTSAGASRGQDIGFDTDGIGTDISGAEDTGTFQADDASQPDPSFGTFSQVYAFTYDYVLAPEVTTLKVYINAKSSGSYHLYALTNEEVYLSAWSFPEVSEVTLPTAQASAVTDTALDASRLLWDTEDKGTDDPADWTGSVSLGPQAAGATVSGQLTGLEADKVYTLRFYGEHGAETEWSIPVTINTDSTPPTLQSTVPADGATDASLHAALVAIFDEPIELTGAGTVTIRNLTLGSDVTLTLPSARVSVAGSQLTIAPPAVLDGTTDYAVRISADAVRDLNANPFAGIADDTTWNFRTAAPVTGGRFEITPDKIVGTPTYPVVGTLHVVDWPSSMGSSISAPAGPDWPEDADDGFKLLNSSITPEGNRTGWEPDGSGSSVGAIARTGYTYHGIMQWIFDLPNGAIIHNVYAYWIHQRNSGSGHTYSYDEGTPTTMARPDRGSVGNLVLKWTALDNTSENVGFERVFEGPITVAGGDGFALTFTAAGNGFAYIDAVVVDFTIPPPAGTVILVR